MWTCCIWVCTTVDIGSLLGGWMRAALRVGVVAGKVDGRWTGGCWPWWVCVAILVRQTSIRLCSKEGDGFGSGKEDEMSLQT